MEDAAIMPGGAATAAAGAGGGPATATGAYNASGRRGGHLREHDEENLLRRNIKM